MTPWTFNFCRRNFFIWLSINDPAGGNHLYAQSKFSLYFLSWLLVWFLAVLFLSGRQTHIRVPPNVLVEKDFMTMRTFYTGRLRASFRWRLGWHWSGSEETIPGFKTLKRTENNDS